MNFTRAVKVLTKHYGNNVTEWQAQQAVRNIVRKHKKGNLDDKQEALYQLLVDTGCIEDIRSGRD